MISAGKKWKFFIEWPMTQASVSHLRKVARRVCTEKHINLRANR